MAGRVTDIHIAREKSAPVEAVDSADAVAGGGLRGDRHFLPGDEKPDLTLIDGAAFAAAGEDLGVELKPGEHRRNVTVSGIDLDSLIGTEFTIGEVRCQGLADCPPCAHLESLTARDGLQVAMTDRGGLEVRILSDGVIRVGDTVEPL
ncbi:MOSC domain-containing protein [Haladaptatus sp. CMSO5]|uniref:MOSC domain-containing protein n=1 Tax=Haladaptatus sp. CMSO5 TaxID=3120514 RepID=UPI002FCE1F39